MHKLLSIVITKLPKGALDLYSSVAHLQSHLSYMNHPDLLSGGQLQPVGCDHFL